MYLKISVASSVLCSFSHLRLDLFNYGKNIDHYSFMTETMVTDSKLKILFPGDSLTEESSRHEDGAIHSTAIPF